ncbi:aspartyl/asparaginyl beta-hydroxylase domain-containing protein [Salinicola tamaricis]|uniref:aspartyl/asparaginyl beta-hydroxylase domain-containing protein n=1 Tax=Salinicola tamaricis TaxID=1771309 RepID=UPI001F5E051A|nr:aspartyl/asparaginyl beta-hydroxylase domain-containing protein [Salinicola tamaricis]
MKYGWARRLNRFVGRTLAAASSPNDDSDRTGGLNRAFKYLYAVRRQGKALKKRNKTLYYAIKWALFALVVIAIIAW